MVQSLWRVLAPAGVREPLDLLPGRGRRRRGRHAGSGTCRSSVELAREAIAAVEAEGYELNVYVDDELYVAARDPETPSATRRSSGSRCTRSATSALARSRPPTKLVCVGDPDALDVLGERMRERFDGRLWVTKSLPFFLEFATVGVSKGSGLDFLVRPSRLLAGADGRPSATARTTSSSSSGAATASRSRTPSTA